MRRVDVLVFASLVLLGASLRIALQYDWPNFPPVTVLALLAGYCFRSRALALAVPMAIMVISDRFLAGYDYRVMAVVYAMLSLPALLGGPLRRWLRIDGRSWARALGPSASLLGCGLFSVGAFYVATNFAHWLWFPSSYERNLAGLMACYVAGVPFLVNMLQGNLVFGAILFGGHAVATRLSWLRAARRQAALAGAER